MGAMRWLNRLWGATTSILVALLAGGAVLLLFGAIGGVTFPTGWPAATEAPEFEPPTSGPPKLASSPVQHAATGQRTTPPRAADATPMMEKSGPPLSDELEVAPTADQVWSSIAREKAALSTATQALSPPESPFQLEPLEQPLPPGDREGFRMEESGREFSFAGQDEMSDTGGIGTVSAGYEETFLEEKGVFSGVLRTQAFSTPASLAFSTATQAPPPSESPFKLEPLERPLPPGDREGSRMEESGRDSTSEDDEKQTFGKEPEKTTTPLQFLRRQSILLDPGEYEFDVTVQYLIDEADFALARVQDDVLLIGEARRRRRLLLVPLEFRVGISSDTQAFVNVPFGWSNDEFTFVGEDKCNNVGGIGDVSAGLTKMLIEGSESSADVLGTLAFSAPTGPSEFSESLATPGSVLGEGYWSVLAGLTFIRIYDPVVLFYGAGYRHRFKNTFDNGISVNPGKQIFYRLGAGFAVNPRVTFSASFLGSYITENVVNGVRLAGDSREPMQLRLAATIAKKRKCNSRKSVKTIEPYVNFGLTEEAINSIIGISWTR